jgi:hypothetical protein
MSEQLIKDSNLTQLKKLSWKQSISLLSFYFSFLLSNYLLSLFLYGQNKVFIGLGLNYDWWID